MTLLAISDFLDYYSIYKIVIDSREGVGLAIDKVAKPVVGSGVTVRFELEMIALPCRPLGIKEIHSLGRR